MKKTFLYYIKFTLALLLFWQLGYSQESQNSSCIGRTVLNSTGGTTTTNGIKVTTSGAGNMQVVRLNAVQIYADNLDTGTSAPFTSTSAANMTLLFIGNTLFSTNSVPNYYPTGFTNGGTFTIVSNTCQASVGPVGGTQQNTVRLKAVYGGLNYFLNIIYNYVYPNDFLTITYQVEIPATNTQTVKLAHAFDTTLLGGDTGSGFVKGTAPYLSMGVQKTGAFEAFNYISGVPWSGYYSAVYNQMYNDLGSDGTFSNTIDPAVVDNGIGISMNFGSTPGTYSSVNSLSFSCAAPSTAPSLTSSFLPNTCPSTTANLNSLYTGTLASGIELRWFKSTGEPYTTPTQAVAGSYYAAFYDTVGSCYSPTSSTVTVTTTTCCSAGTTAPTLSVTSIANSCPTTPTVNLNSLVTSTLPSGASLKWYKEATHTNELTTPTAVAASGTYYAFYYDATNNCYSPASVAVTATVTLCPIDISNACPTSSVDLALSLASSNVVPAGYTLTYHSGTPATTANKLTSSVVTTEGTYYGAYYFAAQDCYTDTGRPLVVTLIDCCAAKIAPDLTN